MKPQLPVVVDEMNPTVGVSIALRKEDLVGFIDTLF